MSQFAALAIWKYRTQCRRSDLIVPPCKVGLRRRREWGDASVNMSIEDHDSLAQQEQDVSPSELKAPLFERLIPILLVEDLQAERDFYVSLGFTVTYQGTEFPDFIALGHGSIEFGISRRESFSSDLPDRVLTWQFGVTDVDLTKQRLTVAGVAFREEWVTPREDWKYRVLHARTPNGYYLLLEGPAE